MKFMDKTKLKATIITLVMFSSVAGLFFYDSSTLGEAYTTTGRVISFSEITKKDKVIDIAIVKLENGHEAIINNKQYSTGILLNLICYRTQQGKTQSCKVKQ